MRGETSNVGQCRHPGFGCICSPRGIRGKGALHNGVSMSFLELHPSSKLSVPGMQSANAKGAYIVGSTLWKEAAFVVKMLHPEKFRRPGAPVQARKLDIRSTMHLTSDGKIKERHRPESLTPSGIPSRLHVCSEANHNYTFNVSVAL